MALDQNINTLEKAKFIETADDKTSVRVSIAGGLAPEIYDEVQVTYPSAAVEVYTFNLSSNPVSVVTVTYSDSSKENLVSVART